MPQRLTLPRLRSEGSPVGVPKTVTVTSDGGSDDTIHGRDDERMRPRFWSTLSKRRFSSVKAREPEKATATLTAPTVDASRPTPSQLAPTKPPAFSCSGAHIAHYAPIFLTGFDASDEPSVALRSFWLHDQATLLTVNIHTLATQLVKAGDFHTRLLGDGPPGSKYVTFAQVEQSPYGHSRSRYVKTPQLLQGAGLARSDTATGIFLTVDLCPTHKPYEHGFFESLAARGRRQNRPFPVALCVSGLWAHAQASAFQWLLDRQKDRSLDITWVNHSFSHSFHPEREICAQNMLLTPGVDLLFEVFETERILLARGVVPSVFFRFPGLVADERSLKELHRVGLIPLSTDAWLAKNQPARPGSIVMVHGNSNEPEGIEQVMPLIERDDIPFLPLAQAAFDVATRAEKGKQKAA